MNPPFVVEVALPLASSQFTVPTGVWKVPVAFRAAPEAFWVALNDKDGRNGV
ncbi:Uncharacterised protein [Mycobacterium tuberculosis]|nr:Uncharacterised protein [Mycobacterium tuberculosis]